MTRKQKKILIRIIVSAALLLLCKVIFKLVELPDAYSPYIKFVAYMIPYFVIGWDILKKAFKGILNKQVFDENFLMAVATVGAIGVAIADNTKGDYTEAIAVMLFYQIGELFQSYAVGKSRRNISDLMDIRPDYANVERDGKIETVDPDEVEIGSIIVVSAGEKIPIDGVIVEGTTSLDTAALTGESVPRNAKSGDEVISGCINLSGTVKIRRHSANLPFQKSLIWLKIQAQRNQNRKNSFQSSQDTTLRLFATVRLHLQSFRRLADLLPDMTLFGRSGFTERLHSLLSAVLVHLLSVFRSASLPESAAQARRACL